MLRGFLICLLLLSVALGQNTTKNSPAPPQTSPPDNSVVAPAPGISDAESAIAKIPQDAPLITIIGLCDHPSTGKDLQPDCKIVITRAQFEKILHALKPNAPQRVRKSVAETYAQLLVKSNKALEMGLDKRPDFPDRVDAFRLMIAQSTVYEKLQQQERDKVTDKEVEDYYRNHPEEFVQVDVERIFVPWYEPDDDPNQKLTDAEKLKRDREWQKALKAEAQKLHARAQAGEDFLPLQIEAYKFTESNNGEATREEITVPRQRRFMLSPALMPMMDLQPGQITPLLTEDNGYYIFKAISRTTLPFGDYVKKEIRKKLSDEAFKRDLADAEQAASSVTYNDGYFGPAPPPTPQGKAASRTDTTMPPEE
jgi:hypothetical protein